MLFVLMLCLGLLTHSLLTSFIILHHLRCVGFLNPMFTLFLLMNSYVLSGEIAAVAVLRFKSIFLENQENLLFIDISLHVRTVSLALSATFILQLWPTQILKVK